MYSLTAEYGLCILGFLAATPDTALHAGQIADAMGLPFSYTAKVLQKLRVGGYTTSQRGRGGGFRLARDPSQLSLLDVVHFLDGEDGLRTCLLGRETCSETDSCRLHHYWQQVKELRERTLRGLSVADLACGALGSAPGPGAAPGLPRVAPPNSSRSTPRILRGLP